MNKLDKAVVDLRGKLENVSWQQDLYRLVMGSLYVYDGFELQLVGTKEEFLQRSKEMGYINGYVWGKEYPSTGAKPDLPDGTLLLLRVNGSDEYDTLGVVDVLFAQGFFKWCYFKITDTRYKPIEEATESAGDADWWDYDNQKALRLPPVGVECLYLNGASGHRDKAFVVGGDFFDNSAVIWRNSKDGGELYYGYKHDFKPLDHGRKQQAKRKAFVDAAVKMAESLGGQRCEVVFSSMFDAGFKAPEGK